MGTHTIGGGAATLDPGVTHTVVNSPRPRPPSRHSFARAASAAYSDLDWLMLSKLFPAEISDISYHNMSEYSSSDHLAITLQLTLAQPEPRIAYPVHIPHTWRADEQGMCAAVDHFCSQASPHRTSTETLQHIIRADAEKDFRGQTRRSLIRPETTLTLLSNGHSSIEDFLP